MKKFLLFACALLIAVVGVQANIVNLSTISGGKTITLHAGDTVVGSTGSSDINIQVAKGAVVTFKNVHINEDYSVRTKRHAGISPLGNATLVFIGKNVVRGFSGSEPGIFAPRKCALKVMGSGTLEASCGKFAGMDRGTAAGIGAGSVLYQNASGNIVYTDVDDNNSAGNIRMTGTGTFTAIGGEGSAGIGGGYETSCGWIEIMNTGKVIAYGGDGAAGIGTGAHHFATESSMSANCDDITIYSDAIVEAYGGRGAAGIGGGWSAHCGDIDIAEDVRHIRATKGEGAPFSIGEGAEYAYDAHLSSCESVRIGNRYYPDHIAESPFVYPCGQVSNIRATEIGQTQATIKWDPYYDEQEWTIAYVIRNSGYTWTIAHSSEPFITLTDLKPGKEYMVEVRTECGSTHSDYTDHIKFVTQEATVPTEVKIVSLESGIGGSPLMITYDMMDEEGRKYCFGFPNDWPVEGHTYTLDEMLPAYSYTWKYGENKSYFVQAEMNVMYYSGNAKLKALRAYAVDDQGRLWDMKYDADELVSCLAPTSIYLRVITENSATFTWFGGSEDATEWEVRYRPYDTSSWVTKSVSANSYKITGLEAGTKYEAQFRTKCSSTDLSEWTASYVFTTDEAIPEPCLPPSSVTATEITETSARISWTPGGKELAWQLSYITTAGLDQGGEEWKYETAYTNSFVLSSLTASTEYLVQIRAICSDDNQSEWDPNAEVEFTTLDPPAPCYTMATNVRSYYISASTATVLWDADGDAESWQLCYRKKGASSWYWVYPTVRYRDFTGLEELTTYEVRVRAKCGDRSFGEWSDIHEFTTNDVTECDQPQSVTVDDVTNHEVYISWVPGSESDTKWRYYFRPEGDNSWGSNSSTKPSVKLYVRRGTKYYFRVATQCGSGGMESYWIETSFTSLTDAEQEQKEADAAAAAAALEAAREALEAAILDLQILRNYADEYNVSAVVTILDNAINAANEVYMNEDATLDELNDATASARYVANSLMNAFVEAAKIQFKNLLDDMLNDCNSECCQQVISDAKAAVNELSLNTDLSAAENIAVLLGAGEEIYDTAVEAILACKEQDTPEPEMPLNLRASEIKDNSALIAWDGEAENFDLRYKEAVMGPVEYDFSFSLGDWRAVDADGDGYTWNAGGWLSSESYISGVGALSPDNWLISPQIMLGGNISFEARGLNDSWYAEHFAVYVSTTDTELASFTQVSEEFVCESSQYAPYEVDLDGSGPGYVAIRHFNCSDQFALNLKNIVVTMLAADPQAPWNEIPGIEANAFMLESLDSETTYAVQARSHNGVKASEWTPSLIFTTEENTEAIENIFSTDEKAQKILYQNQLFILRGEKIYTVTGQEVK